MIIEDYLDRTGGPFADQEELVARELWDAAIENREPNLTRDHLREMANLPPLEPVLPPVPVGVETDVAEKEQGIKLSEAPSTEDLSPIFTGVKNDSGNESTV